MHRILTFLVLTLLVAAPAMAADEAFRWIGSDGNWYDGNNWLYVDGGNTVGTLPNNDAVWINNGDTVTADALIQSVSPVRVNVGSTISFVAIPTPTGTSTLNVLNQNLNLNFGFNVGVNLAGAAPSFTGVVNAPDGSMNLGNDSTTVSIGRLLDDNLGNTVTGIVDVGGSIDHSDSPATLLIGRYENTYEEALGHAVGQLTAGTGVNGFGEIQVGWHSNTTFDPHVGSATGTLIVESGGLSPYVINEDPLDTAGTLRVGVATGSDTDAYGTADITGNIVNFTTMEIGYANGNASTTAEGHVTLHSSYAQFSQKVGVGEAEVGAENVTGSLTLNPSLVETNQLSIYDAGTMTFHLEGTTRVTDTTVGDPGTYAAANAVSALLDGVIVADFDFTPTAGSHTFDLIVISDTLQSNEMDPSDYQVVGLNGGFAVDFFGVVDDGGTDILRLTISGSPLPIPEPASAMLLAVAGAAVLRSRHHASKKRTSR